MGERGRDLKVIWKEGMVKAQGILEKVRGANAEESSRRSSTTRVKMAGQEGAQKSSRCLVN